MRRISALSRIEKAGLVKLGHVALDGTKIKANASKHKAMSYARLWQYSHYELPGRRDSRPGPPPRSGRQTLDGAPSRHSPRQYGGPNCTTAAIALRLAARR
jgi:hypothetical protein